MRNPPPTPTYPEAKPATSPMRAPQANCFADMETGRCASGSDADSPEAGAHAEPAGEEAAAAPLVTPPRDAAARLSARRARAARTFALNAPFSGAGSLNAFRSMVQAEYAMMIAAASMIIQPSEREASHTPNGDVTAPPRPAANPRAGTHVLFRK